MLAVSRLTPISWKPLIFFYAIEGKRGSKVVCLNGAAARLGHVGDLIIILTYAVMDGNEAKTYAPKIVHVDASNAVTEVSTTQESNEV